MPLFLVSAYKNIYSLFTGAREQIRYVSQMSILADKEATAALYFGITPDYYTPADNDSHLNLGFSNKIKKIEPP